MPLTPAHAAVAWPISRLAPRLPVSAVIVGALSPDFEYLLRLAPASHFSHTLTGALVFCLPISLAAWWLFRAEVAPALVALLPERMRAPLQAAGARSMGRDLAWVPIAMLVGVLTHFVWDACTHSTGWLASTIPALRAPLLPGFALGLRWSQLLQHGSTAIGLALLLLWSRSAWNRRTRETGKLGRAEATRIRRVALAAITTASMGAILNASRAWGQDAPTVLGLAAVGAMDGVVLAAIGLATVIRLSRRRSTRQAGGSGLP